MSGLSVPKKLGCTLFLFCIGGTLYNILEVLWRGYTHWTMFIVGGVCFNLIGRIHTICKKGLLIRCTLCSLAITAVEFVSGCLFNLRLKMNVWNYSNMLLNIKGQVCLLYSVLWGGTEHYSHSGIPSLPAADGKQEQEFGTLPRMGK